MLLQFIEDLTREAAGRNLDFLIIGGHAVIHHGYVRMTLDLDLLARESHRQKWRELFEKKGYLNLVESSAFIQFSSKTAGWPPVDIMFVLDDTWGKLRAEAAAKKSGNVEVLIPSPRHLVALKLHAASSPTRKSPGKDWTDIEEIVRRNKLDPHHGEFANLIRRYGGEEALAKILKIWEIGEKDPGP